MPKPGPRTTHQYTDQFKATAVAYETHAHHRYSLRRARCAAGR
jgi:hypothetical protein